MKDLGTCTRLADLKMSKIWNSPNVLPLALEGLESFLIGPSKRCVGNSPQLVWLVWQN